MLTAIPIRANREAVNASELVWNLGEIPLERIRVQPPLGTATEDDLIEFNACKEGLCELVDGCLVYKDIVIDEIECDGPPETLAQLVHKLGDIPLERILLQPAPGTATEDDLIEINAKKQGLFELVDGVLVEKPVAFLEAILAGWLITRLNNFIEGKRLGKVFAPDAMFRGITGRVRLPDVSFVRAERFPGGRVARVPVGEVPIDLAVEILSPSNTKSEIAEKCREYFASGTQLMWVADPATRTVRVYTSVEECRELTEADTLDGGSVLRGFECSIRQWFEDAETV